MWLKTVKSFLADVEIERIRLAAFQVLGRGVQVSVSEINCTEADCPPVKTIIMVFQEGCPTEILTIHKPVIRVGIDDIREARGQREKEFVKA